MLNTLADALLPPASLAAFAFILFLAGRRWRRLGLLVLAVLVVLSVPAVSQALLNSLAPPPSASPAAAPEAIVILSADGIHVAGPNELEPGWITLDRMRAGAALYRQTHLPVLVSGGIVLDGTSRLATMMARSMQDDFGVPVRWSEDRSRDTWENAEFSTAMLHQAGITRAYLVTHLWHMRRALVAFQHFGLEVTPAPVRPVLWRSLTWAQLIPRAMAWEDSYYALHEWLGLVFYTLRR